MLNAKLLMILVTIGVCAANCLKRKWPGITSCSNRYNFLPKDPRRIIKTSSRAHHLLPVIVQCTLQTRSSFCCCVPCILSSRHSDTFRSRNNEQGNKTFNSRAPNIKQLPSLLSRFKVRYNTHPRMTTIWWCCGSPCCVFLCIGISPARPNTSARFAHR